MKTIFTMLFTLLLGGMVMTGCTEEDPETQKFTVSFDSQGGTEVAAQTVEKDGKVTEPAAPTKEGSVFGGWFKESSCVHAWDFETNTVTADLTLYAKWAAKTCTVTFETNGGNAIEPMEVAEGGLIGNLPIPVKERAAFEGWYTDSQLTHRFEKTTPVTADLTLYAKWTTVTRETLEELVSEAAGLDPGEYTEESYARMHEQYEAAVEVLDNSQATSQEIIDAYLALSQAISQLEALPKRETVALVIIPEPTQEGIVYLTANGDGREFELGAYGLDATGNTSTHDEVLFAYDGLEAWAEGEIRTDEHRLRFVPRATLEEGARTSITVTSADNTAVSQTVTLVVNSPASAKEQFLALANSLPAPSEITLDNYEDVLARVTEANALFDSMSEADRGDSDVQAAHDKVTECNQELDNYMTASYSSFEGNTCVIEGTECTYEADGAFPAGTYTSPWQDDGDTYWQQKLVFGSDHTVKTYQRMSSHADGSQAGEWEIIFEGEYRHTGNQASGGTFTIHVTDYYEDDSPEDGSEPEPGHDAGRVLSFGR